MGTKISALTTTGSAPGGAYVALAYGGENYKIDTANLTVGSSNSSTPSVILGGYEVISSSTTWTAPDNATVIWLTLVGGGGGGGAGYNNGGSAAGGGGGGALYDYFVNVSGGHDYTITLGAGGAGSTAGGTNSVTNGTDGNDSVFEKTTDSSYKITCGGGENNSSTTSGPGGTLTTGANLLPTDITHLASAATAQYPDGSTQLVGGDGEQGYGGHLDNGRSQAGYGGDSGFPMIAAYNAGLSTAGAIKADAGYAWPGWGRYPNNNDRGTAQNWGGAGYVNAAWGGYLGGGGAGMVSPQVAAYQDGGDGIALIRAVVNEE